jgi:hypothetical protein
MGTSKQLYLVQVFNDEKMTQLVNLFVSNTPGKWVEFYGIKNQFVRHTTVRQMDLH